MLLFIGSEAGSSLNWAIIGDLFGRARYATIRGVMAPIYNLSPSSSPPSPPATRSINWAPINPCS